MLGRIRLALRNHSWDNTKLGSDNGGGVEVDEDLVGDQTKTCTRTACTEGPRRAMRHRRSRYPGKTTVKGMLDRDSRRVRASVVPNVRRETLQSQVLKNVKYGSRVYTDGATVYDNLH